jgi:uncharacterized protein (TIGR03083 family)
MKPSVASGGMTLPGERALRDERQALVDTVSSLTPEEFEAATTLCEGWAPRDVLAHVMGVDKELGEYFRAGGWVNTANEVIVGKARRRSREDLLAEAEQWAANPGLQSRLSAIALLGDNAIHHEDILRPLGRTRDIPEASANAILREGAFLGAAKLLRFRVVPTDGGRALGRGTVVRGTRADLGLWLAGRQGVDARLEFDADRSAA